LPVVKLGRRPASPIELINPLSVLRGHPAEIGQNGPLHIKQMEHLEPVAWEWRRCW
jgi:hypothetical protein